MDISVIIPIRDGNQTLGRCLEALKQQNLSPVEVIVVDDCSREDCSDLVRSFGFKPLRINEHREAEHARNKGAELASGDILVFADCDMVIHPDALQRIHSHFCGNHYAAISGVPAPEPDDRTLAARYKHLWMYYSYTNSPEDSDFWISGIGAVKRDVFFELNGFRTTFQTKYGGGDLEFGRRLKQAGRKVLLDTKIQGTHLKRFTLISLLRNDYSRGKGWFRFVVGNQLVPYVARKARVANIYPAFIVSVLLSLLLAFSLALAPFLKFSLYLAAFFALAYAVVNFPLFKFFQKNGGTSFLLKVIPLSLLDHLVAGLGVMRGAISYLGHARSKWIPKLTFRTKLRQHYHRLVNGRTYS
ncbi:MAG: glycosyltransferase family A protein [Candidatus Zixiibacteriota bacterium]